MEICEFKNHITITIDNTLRAEIYKTMEEGYLCFLKEATDLAQHRINLKDLISHIAHNYKHVTHLIFSDTSLSNRMFILHGKTWYEMEFGAYLTDYASDFFNKLLQNFQDLKEATKWEDMLSEFYYGYPEWKDLYDSSKTWQDFFKGVSDRMGEEEFNVFAESWLDKFMLRYFESNISGFIYNLPIHNELYKKG